MGSAVSVQKNPDSAMKLRFSASTKTKKIMVPSHTKNSQDPKPQLSFMSQSSATPPLTSFRDNGSKDEAFFDSQAWLESDCEDDFLSVNGDFTPSRGSTSFNQSSSTGNPQFNKSHFVDRASDLKTEPYDLASLTDKKMRLSELLLENLGGEEVHNDQNLRKGELETKPTKLVNSSKSTNPITYLFPYLSRSNSVRKFLLSFGVSERAKTSTVSAVCSLAERLRKHSLRYDVVV
ncbi:hypothetical protein IFM89_027038 [Coptis chinensis]|uniref:Uncharacterized protein n=1 Tax=Coptis chinensis TaxID=261450 RepID=A0A835LT21_9MAGN|nr:hypothetical protein IFM89_027038 [Coptis chinensis]